MKKMDEVPLDNRPFEEVLSFMKNISTVVVLSEELPFFNTMAAKKQLIYDWDEDNFWVVRGNDEDIVENQFDMSGTTLRLFFDEYGGFSVDQALRELLKQGFHIDIRNAKSRFQSQAEIDEYLKELTATKSEGRPLSDSSLDELTNLRSEY